jgi:phosphoribosylformimino-5-aminoimidazole carboxamide ribotide isomerase
VRDLTDIDKLCAIEEDGVEGVILGRSLYEGTLDFKAAQARVDALKG